MTVTRCAGFASDPIRMSPIDLAHFSRPSMEGTHRCRHAVGRCRFHRPSPDLSLSNSCVSPENGEGCPVSSSLVFREGQFILDEMHRRHIRTPRMGGVFRSMEGWDAALVVDPAGWQGV